MALIATMSALILGLLVASANSSYQRERSAFEQMSADLLMLDRLLGQYGSDASQARDLLRRTVTIAFERIWPQRGERSTLDALETMAAGGAFYDALQGLSPQDDRQRWLHGQALQIAADLAKTRWLLLQEQHDSSLPMPFLVALVFLLSALFVSFGLFAPGNATVVVTLFVCALSASGAIGLILELDQPFDGLIQISDAPLRSVLAQLGR
jgi:hypothetical protein